MSLIERQETIAHSNGERAVATLGLKQQVGYRQKSTQVVTRML
jgi:hypothetical protein